jgi:chromosome segregation ATPase
VKIRNCGPDAFRPDVYGDVIIVERKLVKDGNASYKIKSKAGKTISTKREELTLICDHLQIEVDNPMAILTQDTAKMFLANSSPKEKYQV